MRTIDRRCAIKLLALGLAVASEDLFANENDAAADPGIVSDWMEEALTVKGSDSPLKLERFLDPFYIVEEPLIWTPNYDQKGYPKITVPRGFVTDLASIPRIFWTALRPDGEYAYAAIVHDYLYWNQKIQKNKADYIFKMSMEDFELSQVLVQSLYISVAVLGEYAWKSNKEKKKKGEKRVLKVFPPSSRVRWEDWRKNEKNFV